MFQPKVSIPVEWSESLVVKPCKSLHAQRYSATVVGNGKHSFFEHAYPGEYTHIVFQAEIMFLKKHK